MSALCLKPISLKEANEFVVQYHRHHSNVVGHKFSIGVEDSGRLVGVVICGRPVSRLMDDGWTLEVTRLCTDGTANVCSMLYGAARRAAKAMGYRHIITYILDTEDGASLRASGYAYEADSPGGDWHRGREPDFPTCRKKRYGAFLAHGKHGE